MSNEHPIAGWLKARGQSQSDFAREAGISAPHLTLVMKGKRRLSPDAAMRIESLTGIDARVLLGLRAAVKQAGTGPDPLEAAP